MLRDSLAERLECLVCNSTKHCHMFIGEHGQEISICEECGFIFATRYLADSAVRSLLRDGYANRAGDLQEAWHASHRAAAVRRRIQFINTNLFLRPNTRVLEVGSFIGHFLSAGLAEGWHMEGVEPEECTANFSREKTGAIVHNCFVEMFLQTKPHGFDGICLFHVLEHLPDPVHVLKGFREVILGNGWLCLEVPNGDLCGEGNWARFFNADETHLWFFSLRSLRLLLAQAGWYLETTTLVPAYSGAKGAILAFARRQNEIQVEDFRDPMLARSTYRRLRFMRWYWLLVKGPLQQIYNRIKYWIWINTKARWKATRA